MNADMSWLQGTMAMGRQRRWWGKALKLERVLLKWHGCWESGVCWDQICMWRLYLCRTVHVTSYDPHWGLQPKMAQLEPGASPSPHPAKWTLICLQGLLPDTSYHSCSPCDLCGLRPHFHDGAGSSCKPPSTVKGSPSTGKFNSNLNL